MKFELTVIANTDAFAGDRLEEELTRILQRIIDRLPSLLGRPPMTRYIADSDGNIVGHWLLREESNGTG